MKLYTKGLFRVVSGTALFIFTACLPLTPVVAESVLRIEGKRISGFDPALAMDVPSSMAVCRIYEGLLQYSYLDRPYRVQPCLAEAMPEVSADGLVYTFRVRRGIFFQDDPCFTKTGGKGREVRADDFVYGIKRTADVKVGSPGYWAFRDRIVGLDEFRGRSAVGGADYGAAIAGLETPDPYTLRFRLKRPFPALLWILTMNFAHAVPQEAVDYYGAEFVSHPVGTGAYVLKSYIPNYRMEFVRNPKWRETIRNDPYPGQLGDAGKPLPFIDRIVQHVVSDPSTQWLLFLAGKLDVTVLTRDNWDAVITPQGGLCKELASKGILMDAAPSLDTAYVGFNMDDPVVGRNRFLRQAMMSAFDRARWVRFQNGRVTPAVGPIPPGIRPAGAGDTLFPFDLARARELMVKAGYPGGKDTKTGRRLELTLELGSGDSETREMAEVLASFMEPIGIVVMPSFNNWPSFLKKIEQKRAQLFYLTWVADYPDPENYLQLFYGPSGTPGANRCNYRNPGFDKLYQQAVWMREGPERDAVYVGMERIVQEDCPWLFLHHTLTVTLRQPWVRNYKLHDFPMGMTKYWRLEAAGRRVEESESQPTQGPFDRMTKFGVR